MDYRVALLTENDARRYQVVSISSFDRRPGLYFATLKAPGLPELLVKVKYISYCSADSPDAFYSRIEIRESGNSGAARVQFKVEEILGDKVKEILRAFKDVDYEAIRKEKERVAACQEKLKSTP